MYLDFICIYILYFVQVLPVLESLIGSIPRPTSSPRHELLLSSIGDLSYFRDIEGRFILVDLFLLIARNWNLYDILNLNITELESTIVQHPVSRNSEAIVWFILNRIMRNQTSNNQNIEEAANRIYVEMAAYINIFVSEDQYYYWILILFFNINFCFVFVKFSNYQCQHVRI